MYLDYFGLKEAPFSIAPDPHYLFMSEQHREALAHLLYGVRSEGGFVLLTGEVGTGKTTVCRCLLEQLPKESLVAFILNPRLSSEELLAAICDEFRIPYQRDRLSIKSLVDRINAFLLHAHAKGRNPVLIIDEAQNFAIETLEQLRLLTNLETSRRKLLQVILLGQPELRDLLARKELRQLAQRVTARFHLGPLSADDVAGYVAHRLAVAGVSRPLFPPRVLRRVHKLTGGVPRLINVLCDRALLGASVEGRPAIAMGTLRRAFQEVRGEGDILDSPLRVRWWLVAILVFLTGLFIGQQHWLETGREPVPETKVSISPDPAKPLAAEATVKPVLSDWLAARSELLNEDEAFRTLLDRWGVPFKGSNADPACAVAEENGLRCLYGRGSFESLRRINLPTVLSLLGPDGTARHVTLVRLDARSGTLQVGEETAEFSLAELGSQWLGQYSLVWQPPPGYQRAVRRGDRGEVVSWIGQRLSRLMPDRLAEAGTDVFDGALFDSAMDFQADAGLARDGIVGPQTLIQLGHQTDADGPRLSVEAGI